MDMGKANGSTHLAVTVWLLHAASLAYGLPCMLLRACPMEAIGPGPRPGISSAWFRVPCRRGEVTGQRLPMVEAWIIYIFRVSCPFWKRFCGYNSHGRESRASRGLLSGLEEDEAVTAHGDITVEASSSRVIYQLHWSPFLKPNRVEPLEVQAQGLVQVPLDMPSCTQMSSQSLLLNSHLGSPLRLP
jgi:hypothetical protein